MIPLFLSKKFSFMFNVIDSITVVFTFEDHSGYRGRKLIRSTDRIIVTKSGST